MALGILSLASCAVKPQPTLDAGSVSGQIAAQLSARYQVPSPHVVCPAGVPDRKGQIFTCSGTLDGQTVDLDATITGSGGRFTVVPRSAIIVVASRAAQLTADIDRSAHVTSSVDCGPRAILVVPVGQTFGCQVSFPGQRPREATVKVTDVQGDFDYTVAPASAST